MVEVTNVAGTLYCSAQVSIEQNETLNSVDMSLSAII